jgi:hypothetical protein
MKNILFWDVTPYRLVVVFSFGVAALFLLPGRSVSQTNSKEEIAFSEFYFILKIQAVIISEASVNFPEDSPLRIF